MPLCGTVKLLIVIVSLAHDVLIEKLETGGLKTLSIFDVLETHPFWPVTVSVTEYTPELPNSFETVNPEEVELPKFHKRVLDVDGGGTIELSWKIVAVFEHGGVLVKLADTWARVVTTSVIESLQPALLVTTNFTL